MEENTFGELLSLFRSQANKTQLELSIAISHLDYPIDASTLSKYESGSRRPEAEFIPYYALALRLPEEEEGLLLEAYISQDRVNALQSYLRGKENARQLDKWR